MNANKHRFVCLCARAGVGEYKRKEPRGRESWWNSSFLVTVSCLILLTCSQALAGGNKRMGPTLRGKFGVMCHQLAVLGATCVFQFSARRKKSFEPQNTEELIILEETNNELRVQTSPKFQFNWTELTHSLAPQKAGSEQEMWTVQQRLHRKSFCNSSNTIWESFCT